MQNFNVVQYAALQATVIRGCDAGLALANNKYCYLVHPHFMCLMSCRFSRTRSSVLSCVFIIYSVPCCVTLPQCKSFRHLMPHSLWLSATLRVHFVFHSYFKIHTYCSMYALITQTLT